MNIEQSIVFVARHLGLISLILFFFRKRIPILMVHGVMSPNHQSPWWPVWARISEAELEGAVERLSRKYKLVSIDTAAKMLYGSIPLEPYTLVITFDDGYSNNFSHAWPILKKYRANMTVYIATRYVKDRIAFWIDRVDYALHCLAGREKVEVSIADWSFSFDLSSRATYNRSYASFRKEIKNLDFTNDYEMLEALDDVAKQLESLSGASIEDILDQDPWVRPVTMDELQGLEDGITIGAHTVNHIRLTHVSPADLKNELEVSKKELEEVTGTECQHFCYPNGNVDEASAQAVQDAGFNSAVSCRVGTNQIGTNLYWLKRLPFPSLRKPGDIDIWLARQFLKEYFSRK